MKNGFSLVELSIVLVILGLLTGGILAGQSLIRASEIRAASSEYARYLAAIHTFRDKYFATPGDMSGATKFWGAADSGDGIGTDCHGVNSTTTATCNGDGSGQANSNAPTATGCGVNANGERFRFWQHLANAGLIEGSYSGRTDSAASDWVLTASKNVPTSRLGGAVWTVEGIGNIPAGHANYFERSYNTEALDIRTPAGTYPITPEEAWNIDTKMDDGKAGTGSVFTIKNSGTWAPNCSTTDVAVTAEYNVSNSTAKCLLFFAARK